MINDRAYSLKSILVFSLIITLIQFLSQTCYADIVLHGNQTITTPTVYNNVVLDLTDGRFTVQGQGSLTISNSTINITISPSNPYFILLSAGNLSLGNNIVNVSVNGITPDPLNPAAYNLIQIQNGSVSLTGNSFIANTAYTIGFLTTQASTATNGFSIGSNTLLRFHGGIYLQNSSNANVYDNRFSNVSFANILNNQGNYNSFTNNIMTFPGNLSLGDGFDIINSHHVTIQDNIISSGSNYGIFIAGGQNLVIDTNNIIDGLSYGIRIQTPSISTIRKSEYLSKLIPLDSVRTLLANTNITINNNYIAQNCYGLSGGVVDQLTVTNNIFIQRFENSVSRQFWTNNANLLPLATNVIWLNNLYKEAFTQDNEGNNTAALQFLAFPATGGVYIPDLDKQLSYK